MINKKDQREINETASARTMQRINQTELVFFLKKINKQGWQTFSFLSKRKRGDPWDIITNVSGIQGTIGEYFENFHYKETMKPRRNL